MVQQKANEILILSISAAYGTCSPILFGTLLNFNKISLTVSKNAKRVPNKYPFLLLTDAVFNGFYRTWLSKLAASSLFLSITLA